MQAHTAPVYCIRALGRAGQRATQIASSGAFPDVGFQVRWESVDVAGRVFKVELGVLWSFTDVLVF